MVLADYIMDQTGLDWPKLLAPFHWLLPQECTVWIVNRYGDLIFVEDDGRVNFLDIGGGTISSLAASRDEFTRRIDDSENANDWLMIPLVDQCVAAGLSITPGQCYSYRQPPVLGGDYTVANTFVTTVANHYAFYGDLHNRIRDVPDGAKIRLDLRP